MEKLYYKSVIPKFKSMEELENYQSVKITCNNDKCFKLLIRMRKQV